ncbi:hypothetical protein STEG23_036138 [Scotinomys teguina]
MMNVRTSPTLMYLARRRLLRNENLVISALEDLPRELFPALFKDAFNGRHTRIVKAMAAAWPLSRLTVGTCIKNLDDLKSFHAVLEGVDMHLARNFHLRRSKLQVLDLRNVGHDFWDVWTVRENGDCPVCSAETVVKRPVVKVPSRYALRQRPRRWRLKVVTDFYLRLRVNEEQARFLHWARQRKGSLQLCCTKMVIWGVAVCTIKKILNVFRPDHIEELELNTGWDMSTLARFAPCLGQMRSLLKLSLARVYKNTFRIGNWAADREEKCISKIIAQFSKFNCLQHLSMNGLYFLKDQMNEVLRCLRNPLETLSITRYHLSQSDLNHFPCCHSLSQLKRLDLKGISLFSLCLKPLGVLLENVADTLESLELQGCGIKDSQLADLIPALSQCSQLTKVNFSDNEFSMSILKDLLHHTVNWTKMNMEQYPAPLQCYDDLGYISVMRFPQLCRELMDTLRAIRQPKRILFSTNPCDECIERCVYDLGPRLCRCWQ